MRNNNNFVSKIQILFLPFNFLIYYCFCCGRGYFMLSDNMFKSTYERQRPISSRTVSACVQDCGGQERQGSITFEKGVKIYF